MMDCGSQDSTFLKNPGSVTKEVIINRYKWLINSSITIGRGTSKAYSYALTSGDDPYPQVPLPSMFRPCFEIS